jgi:hypothetical protein
MAHHVRTGAALTSGVIVETGTGTSTAVSAKKPAVRSMPKQETDARDRLKG